MAGPDCSGSSARIAGESKSAPSCRLSPFISRERSKSHLIGSESRRPIKPLKATSITLESASLGCLNLGPNYAFQPLTIRINAIALPTCRQCLLRICRYGAGSYEGVRSAIGAHSLNHTFCLTRNGPGPRYDSPAGERAHAERLSCQSSALASGTYHATHQ